MFHTFGCPCFVLYVRLQSGIRTFPKQEPRPRLKIYVGHSPEHAGTVALILNPRTGHASPKFHIVFDYLFTTVPFMNKIQLPPNWAELVKNSRELVTEKIFNLAKTWLLPYAHSSGNAYIPEPSPILQQAGNFGTNATPTTVTTESPTSNILASSQASLPG